MESMIFTARSHNKKVSRPHLDSEEELSVTGITDILSKFQSIS